MRRRRGNRGEGMEGTREGARQEKRSEGMARRGTEGRTRREGWTGWWIRRLAAIDFSRQTRGLFVPLLVLVLLPSDRSLHRSRVPSFPPHRRLRPAHPAPADSSVPSILALSCSLFALLLVNAAPPFDSRSAFSSSLRLSLFSSTHLHLDIFLSAALLLGLSSVSRSFSRSFLLYLLSRVFLRDLISLSFFLSYT